MNLSTIAYLWQLKPRRLYQWYRDVISNYHQDVKQCRFAAHKVYECDMESGEIIKEQVVHILRPENTGASMCIDEKMIGKKYSTIVSNQENGKIALLIDSVKPSLVKQSLELLGAENLQKIKHMNSDMSPVMKKICTDTIPHASIVIDKFHVIKHIMEALNSVRIGIKHQLKAGRQTDAANVNGWTDMELIERSRYMLYKRWRELDPDEQQILKSVFAKHPNLQQAYELVQQIRDWYDKSNIGKAIGKLLNELRAWLRRARESNIKAFKFIVQMFERHRDDILRYFEKGLTNAKAENLNAKIQRFIANNYGIRDKDFFFYRVQVYFAPAPQKKI